MAFLTEADFTDNNNITPEVFAEIFPTGVADSLQDQVKDEITSYVNQRYVPSVLFSGSNRSSFLVRLMVDMVLYHGHAAINSRDVPVVRETRYRQALKDLEQIMLGRRNPPDWPRIEDQEGTGKEIGSRYGSSWYKGIQPH